MPIPISSGYPKTFTVPGGLRHALPDVLRQMLREVVRLAFAKCFSFPDEEPEAALPIVPLLDHNPLAANSRFDDVNFNRCCTDRQPDALDILYPVGIIRKDYEVQSLSSVIEFTLLEIHNPSSSRFSVLLFKASTHSLESTAGLFQDPLDCSRIVVAVGEVMVQGREAMRLALLLHRVELLDFKLVMANAAPIVGRRIHWETGRQRAIHTDDHLILARPAVPRLHLATHEVLHVIQPLDRVHHLVA